MQSETLSINVTLLRADLRALAFDHFKRHWAACLIMLVPLILYFVYLYMWQQVVAVQLFEWGMDGDTATSVSVYGSLVLLLPLTVLARVLLVRFATRGSLIFTPFQAITSVDGLHVERDGMTTDVAWRVVHTVRTTKKRTFIFLDSRTAFIFPNHSFQTDAEFTAFNQTVRRYFDAAHQAAA